MYILREHKVGVRATQRALSLTSPSIASYHLEKLVNSGLIEKDSTGTYQLLRKADIPSLSQYILLGKWIVPRYLFYASFWTIFYFGFLILFYQGELTASNAFGIFVGGISCLIFWLETLKAFLDRPF